MLSQKEYVIDALLKEGVNKGVIDRFILKTYGAEPAEPAEPKEPEVKPTKDSIEEEPKLDPEIKKIVKYYLKAISRLDRKLIMKLFEMVLMYCITKKPKLIKGLIKRFKRMGVV